MEEIYNQINQFRSNPQAFVEERGWSIGCTRPLSISYQPLTVLPPLEEETKWHANHLCGTISHETCPAYCGLFGSCSHTDRIAHFMQPFPIKNPNQVLVQGPKHPLRHLIAKTGHCNHLLDPEVNGMGGSMTSHLFLLSLVWLLPPPVPTTRTLQGY